MVKLFLASFFLFVLNAQVIQIIVLNAFDSLAVHDFIVTITDSVYQSETEHIDLSYHYLNQAISIRHLAFNDTTFTLKKDQIIYLKPKVFRSESFTVYDDIIRGNKRQIIINDIKSHNKHVAEILDSEIGLGLSSYGGSGTLSELKIRGAPANHSIVLIEGIRQNNFQNGSFNLSNVTSLNLSKIDIYQDGASAQFGSDALAGVINLSLGKNHQSAIETYASYGSFNSKLFENKIAVQINENWNIQLAHHLDESDNYFPYLKNNSELAYRNSADHSRKELQAILFYSNSNWFWKTIFKSNENNSGIPGPKKNQSIPFKAGTIRQIDQSNLFITRLRYMPSKFSLIESSIALNPQTLLYQSNDYHNNQTLYNISISNQLKYGFYIASKLEHRNVKLVGSVNFKDLRAERKISSLNQQIAWSDKAHNTRLAVDLNIRQEWQDNKTAPLIIELIGKSRLVENIFFSLRFANHFRNPTFNELFWPNAGNPNLKRETGISRSIGLNWIKSDSHLKLNYFYSDFENLIVWINDEFGQLSVLNLNNSSQSGFQFSSAYRYGKFNFSLDYLYNKTLQNSKLAINVIPNEFILKSQFSINQLELLMSWKWTDNYPVFNSNKRHPIRNDLNLAFAYKISLNNKLTTFFNLKVQNLLNEYSPPFLAYPKPNRNFDIGIKLTFKL